MANFWDSIEGHRFRAQLIAGMSTLAEAVSEATVELKRYNDYQENQSAAISDLVNEDTDDIIDKVIVEIERDILTEDTTAVAELLSFVPVERLLGYLPEDTR